jgi:HK97 family phage portal protein
MSSFVLWRQVAVDLMLAGNAYLQITMQGRDLWLVRLDPSKVTRKVTTSGSVVYLYQRDTGAPVPLVEDVDVWHLQAWSPGGTMGLGLIDAARETLGMSLSAQSHAGAFFRRGVKPSGVLVHPRTLKPATASAMGESFEQKYGGAAGAGKVPVLWEGMDFKPLALNNRDAQFLETYKEGAIGIATFCGVPPHMVGQTERSTSWGTGIEEQRSEFVTFTVIPDCELFEDESERIFLSDLEMYVRKNPNVLLRGKTLERFQVYQIGVNAHIMPPNQCRELEEWDPIPGGDKFPAVPGATNGTEATLAKAATVVPEDFARAGVLAASLARQILGVEVAALAAAAKDNASDANKWSRVIGSFYGRHAAHVAETLGISHDVAAGYCKQQQKLATDGGAAALESWVETHKPRLMALALQVEG